MNLSRSSLDTKVCCPTRLLREAHLLIMAKTHPVRHHASHCTTNISHVFKIAHESCNITHGDDFYVQREACKKI